MIRGMKTGFMASGAFSFMPTEEVCEIFKGIGYDAIEFGASWVDRSCAESSLAAECAKVAAAGLEISEIVVQEDYVSFDADVRAQAIEKTAHYIRTCTDAGIKTLNLFTGPRPWMPDRLSVGDNITQGQAWDMVFTAFDKLVPMAEKYGAELAVENVWGMLCCDFYTLSYLINHYNSPCLGVNYDPSHDQLKGNTDTEFIIRQWGDRIKHIHMKDAAGSQERGKVLFPPLGAGMVDWNGFAKGLDAIGYNGVLSVEYEAFEHLNRNLKGNWIKAAEESFEALKAILTD